MREDRERGDRHQDHARRHRGAEVQGPGLSEQPEDEHRHRRRRRPHDEERWRRTRRARSRRRSRPPPARHGRRSAGRPHATPERVARRASPPPRAGAGRWRGARASSRGSTNGNRDQGLRDRDEHPGRAQIERRLVERDEEPESDGHRRHPERQRHECVERTRCAVARARPRRSHRRRRRARSRARRSATTCRSRRRATRTSVLPRCSSSSAR